MHCAICYYQGYRRERGVGFKYESNSIRLTVFICHERRHQAWKQSCFLFIPVHVAGVHMKRS